ncbi:MAG TPA: hypothetical protein VNY36_00670, partial [Bacteroidia bacterium]|nr:hypothetical protein [Bacteroidia bacterium]
PGKGTYTEFPISTITASGINSFTNRVLLKYLSWSGNNNYGDGQSIVTEAVEYAGSDNVTEMISVELLNSVKLQQYIKFLVANNYMQFISHPKMLSAHNIDTFARFLKKAFALYSIQTDFEKMLPE